MNADRPFVDTPAGDVAAATELATEFADRLGLGPVELLRAAMNVTFGAGDAVVRVGRPTADARLAYDLAERLLAARIRVPRPRASQPVADAGDLRATVWERIDGTGVVDWRFVGGMINRLHDLPLDAAGDYPVPPGAAYPWWRFDDQLATVEPLVDAGAFEGLRATVERHRDWDQHGGVVVLCHGDVHPGNVLAGAEVPVILDWDLLCAAPPAWDHGPLLAMVARWGVDPAAYEAFANGYGTDLRDHPATTAIVELRLVAATVMRVLAESEGGASLEPDGEASRRLRYWRGDPEAPTWTLL